VEGDIRMTATKMGKTDILTKILAISGSALVWLTILLPVILGAIHMIRAGRFVFDFLIPAEIFPAPLLGSLLLLWAAVRARRRRAAIGWWLAAVIGFLGLVQALAEVTGLASGETGVGSWQGVLVIALFGLFWAALLVIALGGLLLAHDVFKVGLEGVHVS
jgi:hypothetical protein